jgi:ribosomal protein S18 acetylase RimI-like enzyme
MEPGLTRAQIDDLEKLTELFDAYRQFYQQPPDAAGARQYLRDRLANDDSVIFIATDAADNGTALGFVQLYASFDSVILSRIWILHDLFVIPAGRKQGIGRQLMLMADQYCRTTEGARIDLMTAITNSPAQALYESLGYERDEVFFSYSLALPDHPQ